MRITQGFIRYVQQPGAVFQLAEDLRGLDTVFLLGGERALSAFLPRFSLENARVETAIAPKCATQWADARKLARAVVEQDAQVVIGAGGGTALDLAKAVAALSGRPLYLAPTVAATCSAATTLVALYDAQGRRTGSFVTPRPVEGVYVDEELLAQAPQRTLCAGIADGMAKLTEAASACLYPDNPPDPQWRSMMAQAVHLMDIYFTHAPNALNGDRTALEEVCYANLLLTAQITATGSKRRIGEVAHAFYNAVTCLFPASHEAFLHGEIVGVGVLLEMELTGAVAGYTRKTLQAFLRDLLCCPVSLAELRLPQDEISLARLSAHISEKSGLSPMQVVVALRTLLV